MSHLLDVNVLVALVDSAHLNHEAAHRWFASCARWATCPLTQNALVRILSDPAYPTVDATPAEVGAMLRELLGHPRHTAFDDDVSVADEALFDLRWVTSSRQLTDVYLLGLAVRHGARLATFDRRIPHAGVRAATAASIDLIGM